MSEVADKAVGKFTAGPWKICDDAASGDGILIATDRPETDRLFAIVGEAVPQGYGPSDSVRDANARLIAAAPDLLLALIALVKANEQWNASVEIVVGRPAGWTDCYLDQARAAIAKAVGG